MCFSISAGDWAEAKPTPSTPATTNVANNLVTMTLTGAQLYDVLEQQFCGTNDTSFRVLLPSAGVHYTWDQSEANLPNADCSRDVVTGLTLNGAPVLDGTT